jgi:hypothetical protein
VKWLDPFLARRQWLTPVILATQEAEIRRILVQSQPRQVLRETLSRKHPSPKKKKAGGVAQGAGPELKPQYCKNKERKERREEGRKGLNKGK